MLKVGILRSGMLSAVIVACALLASASSALASETTAKWVGVGSTTIETEWNGELTLKLNNANAKTCTGRFGVSVRNEGAGSIPSAGFADKCTGSTVFSGHFFGVPLFNTETGYHLVVSALGGYTSPYGAYEPSGQWVLGWTNGTETTPSHVAFSNTDIGSTSGGIITATGTLNATKKGGASLTLTNP